MIITKTISGRVIQTYDTKAREWTDQEFVPDGDETVEDYRGNPVEGFDECLETDMVKPLDMGGLER